jgi:hypothetical protein
MRKRSFLDEFDEAKKEPVRDFGFSGDNVDSELFRNSLGENTGRYVSAEELASITSCVSGKRVRIPRANNGCRTALYDKGNDSSPVIVARVASYEERDRLSEDPVERLVSGSPLLPD